MADKVGKYLFGILVPVLLVIGLMEYMHSAEGAELFSSMLGEYPFADHIMKIVQSVIGYQSEIPLRTTSSVAFDMAKLLISAMIKSGVVSLLLTIFCSIPDFDEGALRRIGTDRIEATERYMNRPGYLLKALLINVAASLVVVCISNEILGYARGYVVENFAGNVVMVFSGVLLTAAIVAAVVVFSRAASATLGISLLWIIFAKLFPRILDVFGLNVLCLCLYASLYTYGFQSGALGWVFMIFVWSICADIVKKSLQKVIVER